MPAVFDNRCADGDGKIIGFTVGHIFRRRIKKRARIKRRTANAITDRSVKRVRSRRCYDVHNHSGRVAELRRETVRDQLNLADINVGNDHKPTPVVIGRVGAAVELVIDPPQITVDVKIRKRKSATRTTGDIGLQQPEIVRIALNERQILHFADVHHAPQIGFARVGNRSVRRKRHNFLYISGFQIKISGGGLSRRQNYAFADEFLKICRFDSNAISCRAATAESDKRRCHRWSSFGLRRFRYLSLR